MDRLFTPRPCVNNQFIIVVFAIGYRESIILELYQYHSN